MKPDIWKLLKILEILNQLLRKYIALFIFNDYR